MGEVQQRLEHDIRYTQLADEPYLKEWLNSPGVLHWFPMSIGQEVEDTVRSWMSFYQWNCSLTCTIQDAPCGIGTLFLMPYRKVAHHCVFKIIVAPQWQKRGIGSSLLKNLMHLAKNYFRLEILHMEVYEGNPMISLLIKSGFQQFARQEHFVKENEKYLARLLFEINL